MKLFHVRVQKWQSNHYYPITEYKYSNGVIYSRWLCRDKWHPVWMGHVCNIKDTIKYLRMLVSGKYGSYVVPLNYDNEEVFYKDGNNKDH